MTNTIINNNSMQKLITLTPAQKSKIQNQKQLYVLLRLMNLVQQYHNYDKITKQQYNTERSKLIQKYQGFTRVFPNFNLSQFLKSHDISEEQVLWAKVCLEKGSGTEQPAKQIYIFMQATAKFIQVSDLLAIHEDNPILNQIKTPIQQLLIILKRIHAKIGVEFSQKYQQLQKIYQASISNRPISDVLTLTEFGQLKSIIQSMYKVLQVSMKN